MSEETGPSILCPSCRSTSGLRIVYGLPTADLLLKARQGKIFLAGWRIRRTNRHCSACGYDWTDRETPLEVTEF